MKPTYFGKKGIQFPPQTECLWKIMESSHDIPIWNLKVLSCLHCYTICLALLEVPGILSTSLYSLNFIRRLWTYSNIDNKNLNWATWWKHGVFVANLTKWVVHSILSSNDPRNKKQALSSWNLNMALWKSLGNIRVINMNIFLQEVILSASKPRSCVNKLSTNLY